MTSFLYEILLCMLALLTAKSFENFSVAGSDKVISMKELGNNVNHARATPQQLKQFYGEHSSQQNQHYYNIHLQHQNDNNIQSDEGGSKCGGVLTSAHGVIQTPHFPNKFHVPITCVWVIDASELVTGPNISIVVYLTQLYVLNGLKFTEYMYYSDDYKVPSHRVFEFTEHDVTQVAWIQFTSQYLEIRFTMRTLDGTHLRALDRLLDVYGFNITYEVDLVKTHQCNALQCRFLGHCYAKQDFTSYSCECFSGFSGSDCGKGPLCADPAMNFCENGGTCKHIGDAAVTCLCPQGFTGNKCEIPEVESLVGCVRENNSLHCQQKCITEEVSKNIGISAKDACKCSSTSKLDKQENLTSSRSGKIRYEVTIRLGTNLTAFYRNPENNEKRLYEHLPGILEKHMSRVLRSFNITRVTDLELISNTSNRLDITFHFFGIKGDSNRIREAITRMVERGRLGNFTLVSNFHLFDEDPPFKLQILQLDKNSPIREGSEFSISCVAHGSPKIEFRWFKDGDVVNASKATRDIWTIIMPPEQKGVYTSKLIIDKAHRLDEGVYTCKVVDWGVEDCRSIVVHVQTPPQLRVDPASVTLFRGESLLVRCLSPGNDQQRYGQLGYSWTRNGVLFQSNPNSVMWEDLYPDGSILRIKNIQKSAEFTCLVSNSISPASRSVHVTVIDKGTVELCRGEENFGLHWPSSAPGATVIADCPKRFQGYAKRLCEQRGIGKSTWLIPDFSNCIADQLVDIYNEFRALSLGYQKTNCSAILKACLEYAMKRQTSFLPGEAGFLMDVLQEVEKYLKIRGTHLEQEMAAEIILHILDRIMQNIFAMNSQQQIKTLQELTQSAALNRETVAASQLATSTSSSGSGSGPLSAISSSSSSSSVSSTGSSMSRPSTSSSSSSSSVSASSGTLTASFSSMSTIADSSPSLDRLNSFRIYTTSVKSLPFNLRIYGDDLFSDQLYMDISITKDLLDITSNGTIFASVISYRNLTNFLPKTYYARGSDGPDLDYMPASRIIATWLFQSKRSNDNYVEPLNLPLESGHVEIIFHHESKPKNTEWIPMCGHELKATYESTWETNLCITKNLMENITRCICPLSGTFVVLFAKKNYNTSLVRTQARPIFVIISCGCCFLQSCTAFAFLIPILYNRKCCITFLKMQFCTSTSTVMAIYLLGFLKLLPQDWHGIISSTLASLVLLGLSTLVAITLVIQSELVPKKIQMTNLSSGIRGAIGISWLIPILFAICSPLIYTVIGKWPFYWWLETGSSGFILFIIVEGLFIGLFLLLFSTLLKKLLYLMKRHDKHNISIWRRIGLLYRTGIILFLKLSSDSLFLIYLNTSGDLIISHLFGVCCIMLGFSILFCFVIKAEYTLRAEPLKKIETKTSLEENYCSGSINSPLSFYANHEMEKDNESGPPSAGATRLPLTILPGPQCSLKSTRMAGKSVETFLEMMGGATCKSTSSGTAILVSDKNGVCDTSFHEMETIPSKSSSEQIRCSSKSRCCNILGVSGSAKLAETWEQEVGDIHGFYDSYQSNSHVKCSLSESHEFVGVGTLDILQGVSPDSIIGIRTSSILTTTNNKAPVKCIENTNTNSVKTQTPKIQKRVTIEEPRKTGQTGLSPSESSAATSSSSSISSYLIHQSHVPPIITITSSGDDDTTKPIASITQMLPSANIAYSVTGDNSIQGTDSNLETADEDPIDGMLDRISHDLDYLLNRTSEIPIRRVVNCLGGGGSGSNSTIAINDNGSLTATNSSSSSATSVPVPIGTITGAKVVATSTVTTSIAKATISVLSDVGEGNAIPPTPSSAVPMLSTPSQPPTTILPPAAGNLLPSSSHSRSVHEVIIEESEQE